MSKCPHCGKVAYPVMDENKKVIMKNLFRIDWFTIIMLIIILGLVFAYKIDTKICRDIIENPCNHLKDFNCDVKEIKLGEYDYGINTEIKTQT